MLEKILLILFIRGTHSGDTLRKLRPGGVPQNI